MTSRQEFEEERSIDRQISSYTESDAGNHRTEDDERRGGSGGDSEDSRDNERSVPGDSPTDNITVEIDVNMLTGC